MGVYSTTQANAYADKIKAVYEYLDEIRKVADRLTPVEDMTSFKAQIEALHAQLDLLVETAGVIAGATPTGEAILTGTVASIKTLLEIGVIPPDLVRQADLDARLADLETRLGEGDGSPGSVGGRLTNLELITDQLDQYRLVQQSDIGGLQTSYTNLSTGLQTTQANLDTVTSRLVVQEQWSTQTDTRLATIDQNLASTTSGLQATNSTVAGHTASISNLNNGVNLNTASIDQLTSDLRNTNTNVSAHATAISQMETDITQIGADVTAQSGVTTSLKSVIGGSGNLLPNSEFDGSAAGWRITVAEEDWAATVLTVDTFNMPADVHCLEVLGQPSPLGQIVVESPALLVEENHHYIVSGYPCVSNGTVALSYKVFDTGGLVLDQGTCPATLNTTANTNFNAYTRTWKKFLAPTGASKLHLYLTVTGDGDFITEGALFRPMVERSWAEQAGPSAWTPNIAGVATALEGMLRTVESSLINEIITSANKNASFTASINNLSSRMIDAETGIDSNATAVSGLTTRVTTAENSITSQSQQLTSLQAQVNAMDTDTGGYGQAISDLDVRVTANENSISTHSQQITSLQNSVTSANKIFVQPTAPATSGRTVNDLWIDSDDNNKPYFFDGTNWVARPENSKNKVFVQSTAPTATAVNDLWVHTGDNNKLFRWSGSAWVDITDARITANASAISSLTSRVTTAEGNINSQSQSITTLQNTVNHPTTGVSATASGLNSLTTRVSTAEGNISSQASSIQTLTTSVNNNTASISTHATSINGLNARWGVTLDVNNYVSGVSSVNNGSVAEFAILADKFKIVAPAGGARTEFSGGNWRVYDASGVLRVRMGIW